MFHISIPKQRKYRKMVPLIDDISEMPVVITVPHLRSNHKVSFDLINLAIVALLSIATQNSREHMENIIIRNRLTRESNIR